MRMWPIACALLAVGCAPATPPAVFAGPDWQIANGGVLSAGEYAALRQTCLPQRVTVPFDRAQPIATPARNNPAYRPGGEATINAPPTGIAAIDNPVGVTTSLGRTRVNETVEDCLRGKGLVRGS